VRVRGCGFWMSDSLLELWLRLLALHIKDPVEPESLAAKIRDQWLLASRGYFNGCVPAGLEEAVATPQGEALVRAAIDSLLGALGSAPARLSKDVFNLMGLSNAEFTADIETWRLVEVGQAHLDLLDGKVLTGPGDAALMPGSGQQPNEALQRTGLGPSAEFGR
jgi:hypothetical protein